MTAIEPVETLESAVFSGMLAGASFGFVVAAVFAIFTGASELIGPFAFLGALSGTWAYFHPRLDS